MKYKSSIVLAYFKECGLPTPDLEYKFHPDRKWRFDFSWVGYVCGNETWVKVEGETKLLKKLALEVDGGIWIKGGHNRGAQMLKTWEKENEAVALGWKIIRCEPKSLCTQVTVDLIKRCLC